MGKVLVSATMSLDGFIAGPDDAMDWVFEHAPSGPDAEAEEASIAEVIAATGAILAGRGSYDVGVRAERPETSEPFGGRWSGPELVLTHHPPDDPGFTFLSGDIREAVATALDAAGGLALLLLGANV